MELYSWWFPSWTKINVIQLDLSSPITFTRLASSSCKDTAKQVLMSIRLSHKSPSPSVTDGKKNPDTLNLCNLLWRYSGYEIHSFENEINQYLWKVAENNSRTLNWYMFNFKLLKKLKLSLIQFPLFICKISTTPINTLIIGDILIINFYCQA